MGGHCGDATDPFRILIDEMAAPPNRPVGPDGRPLTPEEQADLERAEAVEQARNSRRWAYFATFVASLAAAAAAVALALLLAEDQSQGRGGASRSSVRDLQDDVSKLQDRVESARERSREAEGSVDSLTSRIDDLESEVQNEIQNAEGPDESTQRELADLSEDVQQLQENLDRVGREADAGSGDGSP